LISIVRGEPGCSSEMLRQRANSLVLRATQAALGTAKGAGYVQGHPVGRWCREALFFLVWSCPQPVVSANLCELAGIAH
jgi:alkylation response protein AidB-like acyl-CoA dehydrogenase